MCQKKKKKTSHSTCCEHRWKLRKSKLYIGLLACVYRVPSVDWSQDLTFSTRFLNRGFCVLSAYQWNKLISKSAALALMAACCLQSHWKLKLCSRVKKSNSRESKQIEKKEEEEVWQLQLELLVCRITGKNLHNVLVFTKADNVILISSVVTVHAWENAASISLFLASEHR